MNFFDQTHYHEINDARLRHLESLKLDLTNKKSIELGAGVGDLSHFFSQTGNHTISEARDKNLLILNEKFNQYEKIVKLDANNIDLSEKFDIVFCYGLLYHLSNPVNAIKGMSSICDDLLIIETCVSLGKELSINPIIEDVSDLTQSIDGLGCRPTRIWIFEELKKHFKFVYLPKTQPNHQSFVKDFENVTDLGLNYRAIFVASRRKIDNENFTSDFIYKYV